MLVPVLQSGRRNVVDHRIAAEIVQGVFFGNAAPPGPMTMPN